MSPDPSIPREPTLPEDLVTFRLGRRVLRRDVGRLCDVADGLLAGTEYLSSRRLEAFSGVAEGLCDDIVGEQEFEEALVWPVLERRAPDALPYSSFRADRRTVRGAVDDARRATRAVVADLRERPAALATAQDYRRVQAFAESWRRLRERLERFFEATEARVAEIVTTRVPREEWADILEEVRRRLPDRRGAGARVMEVATREELEQLSGQLGSRPIAGWRNQGRRRRSEETLAFGPGTATPPRRHDESDDEPDARPG
ncbi:hypothetical protein LQ327_32675 [Actinomycetospora endophytica]|uniref:Hemerythrin-like domain-containing protein n=1 Tax=Actinomycetospora endophytica TaxID=2291215 RepID=A0ABS8PIP2_9PSEU|nr:hypothetical protein [Actinomycetospora endophytica]MCD2198135.1 hypothetical protein [Actinomycetospora endophytica]